MPGFSRVLLVLLLCSIATTLAAKPHIALPDPPAREACSMSTLAWEWDFGVTNGGFTTSSCDSEGNPTWQWAIGGSFWQTEIIEIYYPNNAGDALVSPTWTVGPDNYLMEVDHRFSTELGFDGGNVKVNGQLVTPTGGYPSIISNNPDYYAWCVDEEPGYTGTVPDWVTDCFDLSPWWGQNISVSFEFGSDASVVEGSGWTIRSIAVGGGDPQTHVVNPDGTGDHATIQAAIDAAIPGDTILLGDGMFTGEGNRDLDYEGKAITIRSQSGDPELCYINCEGYADDAHFGFIFSSNEGNDSVLDGVGIIQGYFTSLDVDQYCEVHAAGITCSGASPTITNCVISNCTMYLVIPEGAVATHTGSKAAGIAINHASPVLQDCRVISNSATVQEVPSDGMSGWANPLSAGIACLEGKPLIQNCTIASNTIEMSEMSEPDADTLVPEAVIAGGLAVMGAVQGEILTTDHCTLQGNSVNLNLTAAPVGNITHLAVAGGMALINHQDSGVLVEASYPGFSENSVTIAGLAGYAGKLTVGGGSSWVGEACVSVNPVYHGNWVDLPAGLNCPYTAAGGIAAHGGGVYPSLGEFSENRVSATPITLPKSLGMCLAAGAMAGTEAFLEPENCAFMANQISATPITLPTPPPPFAAAGAVGMRDSGALMTGCVFEANSFTLGQNPAAASMDTLFCAGAMLQLGTESTATGCEFYANSCAVGEEDGGPGLDLNYAAATGGFLQSNGSAILTEVHFYENTTQVFAGGTRLIAGGAVTDPLTITRGVDCLFGGNTASVQGVIEDLIVGGAGGFGELSEPEFENCELWNNHATIAGQESLSLATVAGGLAIRAENPLLTQCGFYGNTGTLGVEVMTSLAGAVAFQYGSPELINCIFEGNSATSSVVLCEQCAVGGALTLRETAATLTGSTLVGNHASRQIGTPGGGVDCRQNTVLTMANTIIAFSEEGSGLEVWDGSSAEISCSDIFGNAGGDWVGPIAGQLGSGGNIHQDPLFCGEHNTDWPLTLATNSPCAADANPDCGQMGGLGVGCGASAIPDQMPLPGALKLHRGYPNPFNPQVTIKFDLPRTQKVTLSVYTLAGEMVTTLVQEVVPAGRHQAVWNGRDARGREMSSGSYLVRLETPSGTEGRKLMLVR